MIEVNGLTKIYNPNKRNKCTALDGVSFVLPDKGMVFIVGKSGCGKSTFLNLLGGLDKPTYGDIIADGNSFADFPETDFDNFHNSYLGFIFQDFCLIETLTVEQNVALALEAGRDGNSEKLAEILEKVELQELAKRFPGELSGGQKQRVAIARALIKEPELILADEPTGNLNEKTGKQIMDMLKRLSSDSLVVIVSHNKQDAEVYADRIIELSDGRVISDRQRNGSFDDSRQVVITKDSVTFEEGVVFTDEEISQINSASANYFYANKENAFCRN